mmetsp:Transcript_3634/g.9256  ORF Transcript_3634/g.9256 Transcript_3634/m.9256 type:complete len:295 (+) Transcript_3634:155-1039(+)
MFTCVSARRGRHSCGRRSPSRGRRNRRLFCARRWCGPCHGRRSRGPCPGRHLCLFHSRRCRRRLSSRGGNRAPLPSCHHRGHCRCGSFWNNRRAPLCWSSRHARPAHLWSGQHPCPDYRHVDRSGCRGQRGSLGRHRPPSRCRRVRHARRDPPQRRRRRRSSSHFFRVRGALQAGRGEDRGHHGRQFRGRRRQHQRLRLPRCRHRPGRGCGPRRRHGRPGRGRGRSRRLGPGLDLPAPAHGRAPDHAPDRGLGRGSDQRLDRCPQRNASSHGPCRGLVADSWTAAQRPYFGSFL